VTGFADGELVYQNHRCSSEGWSLFRLECTNDLNLLSIDVMGPSLRWGSAALKTLRTLRTLRGIFCSRRVRRVRKGFFSAPPRLRVNQLLTRRRGERGGIVDVLSGFLHGQILSFQNHEYPTKQHPPAKPEFECELAQFSAGLRRFPSAPLRLCANKNEFAQRV
jgi:hypothetical protein